MHNYNSICGFSYEKSELTPFLYKFCKTSILSKDKIKRCNVFLVLTKHVSLLFEF